MPRTSRLARACRGFQSQHSGAVGWDDHGELAIEATDFELGHASSIAKDGRNRHVR